MGNKQQNSESNQEIYFKHMQEKINLFKQKLEQIKNSANPSLFEKDLQENIMQGIDTLNQYIEKSKIYIIFMGTTSSGKSTFINALLGQQLLPSRNQDCTNQICQIGHQNTNVNGNIKITINKENFQQLEKASQKLKNVRDSPNMEKINILTQSYFHKQLSQDLQDRVFFIDTAGIKLENCSEIQYVHHFDKINQQIELEENSLRIDIWISDYTTFDRDQYIQKKIISSLKSKEEQYQQQQNQNQYNKRQIQQLNEINSQLFFIINKFDQRNEKDDKPIETIKQGIVQVFESQNIFKISAQKALNYIIMNYGKQEIKEYFISQFYDNNKSSYDFTDKSQAREHCLKRIKNNNNLIQDQDFNDFIQKLSLKIKEVQDENFIRLFENLDQKFQFLKFGEEFKKAKQQLTLEQKNQISVLLGGFQQNMVDYKNQLKNLNNRFSESIKKYTILEKKDNKDQQVAIEHISIQTITELDLLNSNYTALACRSKEQILINLKQALEQSQQQQPSIILEKWLIIFKLMEDNIYEQKKQLVKRQAEELFSKLGIKVNRSFYEKATQLDKNRTVTFNSIINSSSNKIIPLFIASTASTEMAAVGGTVAILEAIELGVFVITPVIASAVAISAIGIIGAFYGFKQLVSNGIQINFHFQLEFWKLWLDEQAEKLTDDYIQLYDRVLLDISSLMS